MASIHCRECGARFRKDNDVFGTVVTCPKCNDQIKVKVARGFSIRRFLHKSEPLLYVQGFLIGLIIVMVLTILFGHQSYLSN